ncbi:MAG: EamA family transporter [Chloroflexota bacterium]|jgi:drug/metabolite transporter (DMT)-like permease
MSAQLLDDKTSLHTGYRWFANATKYLKSRHHLKLVAAFAAVYVIWGSTFLAIRFAVESMPPFWMAGTRFVIAGLVVYIWARRQGALVPTTVHWRTAFIVGGLMLAGGNGLVSWSGQFVASGLIGLLSAAIPMWVVIITSLATRQRPTRSVTLGILLGLAGIIFLIGPENVTSVEGSLLAILIVLLGCISWAVGTYYSRQAVQHPSLFMATGLNMLAGGLLLLLGSAVSGELAQFDPVTISLKSWLALGYLIVFGSLVGFSAYMWLVKVTTPTMASSNFYVNPVVAVILGWALAGEPLTAGIILPAAAIIAAVVLIVSRPAQLKAETADPDQPATPALKTADANC